MPCVYVDTNILKFSATALHRYVPTKRNIDWGGKEVEIVIYEPRIINPNLGIKNAELKGEADLLPEVANLSRQGKVSFVMQFEARGESWGIPNMDSKADQFYGVEIDSIEAPFKYSRVVAGGGVKTDHQYEFLKRVQHPRFDQLQKITGAWQGKNPKNRNQLLDAFHLWCAEHAGVEYFLTLDFKLQRQVLLSNHPVHVKIVRPSELLAIV